MSSLTRQQMEAWLKTIDVKADRVLDVGGSQQSIRKRVKSFNVEEYKILDLEKPHDCKVKPDYIFDLNLDTKFPENAVIEKKLGEPVCLNEQFDVVFCIEVSEYWWNPSQALMNINLFLEKGGLFYFSTHFVYMRHAPEGQDFLRYTPEGVNKLLKETGFEIIEHKMRKAESLHLLKYYGSDKMRGLKGVDHNVIGSLIKAKKVL